MSKKEKIKEQLQEDLLTLLESFGIHEALDSIEWERLKTEACDIIIHNINKLENKIK